MAALVETAAGQPGTRILNCADPDHPTGLDIARIVAALQDNGATMDQVAETISLAAAALLTDALDGSSVRAAQLVAGRISEAAGRQARHQAA